MQSKLYYNIASTQLLSILKTLMLAKEFEAFRLVGGTALSLYRGHRLSVDIDLFTDATYNSIDFKAIDRFLRATYTYVDTTDYAIIGMGKSYYVGENKGDCVKLDLYYTDAYIQELVLVDGIRLATLEEIIAMKIDVIWRIGRKKDFWDLHELMNDYTLNDMLSLHEKRYPWTHDEALIKANFSQFSNADEDFDPICLKGKYWEIIKLDMIDFVKNA
jgi:Nucleotidyl transferase AbiEii toxin, Type IV TA system